MKKIDIYEIALKTFGIYLILPIVTHIGGIIAGHYMERVLPMNFGSQLTKIVQFVALITSFILIIISGLCIFATKWIAKAITNEADRTHELNLNTNKRALYQIVLLITGLIMVLWALPEFCLTIYNHFTIATRNSGNPRQATQFISETLKLIVGILIILSAKPLSTFFEKTSVPENEEIL